MDDPQPETQIQSGLNLGSALGQILIVLIVLLVLVNLPVNYFGTGLAHLMPNSPSLVIRDGMLLKGSGSQIYLLDEQQLRPITSPELFEKYFQHSNINLVEDSLLAQLGQGRPVRRLLKCQGSPEIYALENGRKYPVGKPPLTQATRPWDRVQLVSCDFLTNLPDSPPASTEDQIRSQP